MLKKLEFQNRARKLIPFLKCSSLKSRIGIYNLRFHHVVITIYIDRLYIVLSHNVPPLESYYLILYHAIFELFIFTWLFCKICIPILLFDKEYFNKGIRFLAIFWKFKIFNNFNILKHHCIFREFESETYSKTKYFRAS